MHTTAANTAANKATGADTAAHAYPDAATASATDTETDTDTYRCNYTYCAAALGQCAFPFGLIALPTRWQPCSPLCSQLSTGANITFGKISV